MAIPGTDIGNLAIDAQSLDKLRLQARQAPDQALKAAAQQFETVFLNMMLKSMREATPQDGMFDNEQTKTFTGMLDQQLAQNISARGVGLADVMVRQLSRTQSASVPAPAAAPTAAVPSAVASSAAVLNVAASSAAASSAVAQKTGAATTAKAAPAKTAAPKTAPAFAVPSPYKADVQQAFVDRLRPYAEQASRTTGVPAHLILGQAALESGWGKREIKMADGSDSHNLFGIKAGRDWKGRVAEVTTTEYHNGVAHKQVERFRAYASYTDAFQDYAQLLSDNQRYAGVLEQGDSKAFAQALQQSGYATDPRYADKLVSVIGSIRTRA